MEWLDNGGKQMHKGASSIGCSSRASTTWAWRWGAMVNTYLKTSKPVRTTR